MKLLTTLYTRLRRSQFHAASFAFGMVVALLLTRTGGRAEAFDLNDLEKAGNQVSRSFRSISTIKSGLDGDVRDLRADAGKLLGDKDKVIAIKNQLVTLAAQTKAQIDSITAAVGVVEGHLNDTKTHIQSTGQHVDQIDGVTERLK